MLHVLLVVTAEERSSKSFFYYACFQLLNKKEVSRFFVFALLFCLWQHWECFQLLLWDSCSQWWHICCGFQSDPGKAILVACQQVCAVWLTTAWPPNTQTICNNGLTVAYNMLIIEWALIMGLRIGSTHEIHHQGTHKNERIYRKCGVRHQAAHT